MYAYNYIPSGRILDELRTEALQTQAVQQGYIIAERPVDDVDKFIFQYNPERIQWSRSAEWSPMNAKGIEWPSLHYIRGNLVSVPVSLVLMDDVEGPPNPFQDLAGAIRWFNQLQYRTEELGRPPKIWYVCGALIVEAVVKSIDNEIMESFADLSPRVARIRMELEGTDLSNIPTVIW